MQRGGVRRVAILLVVVACLLWTVSAAASPSSTEGTHTVLDRLLEWLDFERVFRASTEPAPPPTEDPVITGGTDPVQSSTDDPSATDTTGDPTTGEGFPKPDPDG